MKRLVIPALLAAFGACGKPSEDNCRKAVLNIQHLLKTEDPNDTTRIESEIRRCRNGSSKESVECAMNANSLDELRKCGFTHLPDQPEKK